MAWTGWGRGAWGLGQEGATRAKTAAWAGQPESGLAAGTAKAGPAGRGGPAGAGGQGGARPAAAAAAAAAAAGPAGGGWPCAAAAPGGAGTAAGGGWRSAAGSPPASAAGGSAAAAGSGSGAGSACRWLRGQPEATEREGGRKSAAAPGMGSQSTLPRRTQTVNGRRAWRGPGGCLAHTLCSESAVTSYLQPSRFPRQTTLARAVNGPR